ncbi:hypothetical protein HDV00_004429 [Rhizophlyctis rosea]|nr:hypothetical protein HDV00_004429 [Rhizophlyctis rosea]
MAANLSRSLQPLRAVLAPAARSLSRIEIRLIACYLTTPKRSIATASQSTDFEVEDQDNDENSPLRSQPTGFDKPRRAKRGKHTTPFDDILPPDLHLLLRSHTQNPIPYLDAPHTHSPYEYHEEAVVRILAVSPSMHGVGFGKDNWLVAAPNVLEGELVRVKIYRDVAGWSMGEVLEILERHPERVEAKCPYFSKCAGCGYQHLSYEEQLRRKRRTVEKVLVENAGTLGLTVEKASMVNEYPSVPMVTPVVPSPMQYGYRTKLTPHYSIRKQGEVLETIGYNERGRAQALVDVERCAVGTDAVNAAYASARQRLLGSQARKRIELGATLLFRNTLHPPLGLHAREFRESRNDEDGTPQPWPPHGWTQSATTTGKELVVDVVNGFMFRYPSHTFWQTNSSILPAFTSYIRSQLREHQVSKLNPALPPIKYLIDAYCGAGLFAITCSPVFERVVGVEVGEASIAWAERNAKDNGLEDKVKFIKGDVQDIFGRLDGVPADESAVIIDPPAKGCGKDFMQQLLGLGPRVIVYVSCNIKSQVEDLRTLVEEAEMGLLSAPPSKAPVSQWDAMRQERELGTKTLMLGGKIVQVGGDGSYEVLERRPVKGYRIVAIQPFDMFPQTVQLETVITLVREDAL